MEPEDPERKNKNVFVSVWISDVGASAVQQNSGSRTTKERFKTL
jgi:hypothetical protein